VTNEISSLLHPSALYRDFLESPERVRDFYTLIDVFVLPRRRTRLTELVTPLKPLEAMAMGIPVLTSDESERTRERIVTRNLPIYAGAA
jgi:glycosyltransferase involved in cell wall biosynthesis